MNIRKLILYIAGYVFPLHSPKGPADTKTKPTIPEETQQIPDQAICDLASEAEAQRKAAQSKVIITGEFFTECQSILVHSGVHVEKLNSDYVNLYAEYKRLFKEREWITDPITIGVVRLINKGANKEKIKSFCECLTAERKKNNWAVPRQLIERFEALIEKNASDELIEAYKNSLIYLEKNQGATEPHFLFEKLAVLNPPVSMLNTYNSAITENHYESTDQMIKALREIIVHCASWVIIKDGLRGSSLNAIKVIQDVATNDHVPYAEEDPKTPKVRKQTRRVLRRAFNVYHGFTSRQIETRRPATSISPLLYRFGEDVADFVGNINSSNNNAYPGKGIFISGLIRPKIFAPDPKLSEQGKDPYSDYKATWHLFAKEFDDLEETDFIFTRGFIAISCPQNEKYVLDGTHYSYIVFNDHFYNFDFDIAYLVPTEILYSKLKGTIIPPNLKPGLKIKDINEADLLPKDLIESSKRAGVNILNIGWGSNIGGSLSNAYPLDSKPFHEWEIERRAHETKDYAGHVHKSRMFGNYRNKLDSQLKKGLKPLRKAHEQVYRVTNSYQNLYDLFRIAHSLWNKGFTVGTPNSKYLTEEEENSNQGDPFEGKEFKPQDLLVTGDDFYANPNVLRMLEEAFIWNQKRQNKYDDRNHFPILTIADTVDDWKKPDSNFTIDTFDMTARIGDEVIQLNRGFDEFGPDESAFWYDRIMPLVKDDTSKDFRFYHRKDLGLS